MEWGNKPTDGGNLFLDSEERRELLNTSPQVRKLVKRFVGAQELIQGKDRFCLWIEDDEVALAKSSEEVAIRLNAVREMRSASKAAETRPAAAFPHRFRQIQSTAKKFSIVTTRVSSENRPYLPVALLDAETIIGDRNFALYDAPLWNMALIASRLHWVWIGTVCVRMRTDFSYSNTLGWNTFPVHQDVFMDEHKKALTRAAENILLAREAHFPATIADLYKPDAMPEDLRAAHAENDRILEEIYIGRPFRNDTERLEKLFEMYSEMVKGEAA